MERVLLGKTGIDVCKNGFGALPVQRVSFELAARLLSKAFNNGITYFDTARMYTDSEEKIGQAFLGKNRDKMYLATKTMANTADDFRKDLHTSLELMKTDYIDIYQFHNPPFCPKPGGEDGLYDAAIEARGQGKIRFIGITSHKLELAREAVQSGLYSTLQFPFSYLSADKENDLVDLCESADMGFIAMKALAGGLITSSAAAYAYLSGFKGVLPIWGIQHEWELDEFLSYNLSPPVMTDELKAVIDSDRAELGGEFCRSCGYCMPCPVGIEINNCARMSLMLRRAPASIYLSEHWQKQMRKIESCLHCNKCADKCPYSLNTPALLEKNYEEYFKVTGQELPYGRL